MTKIKKMLGAVLAAMFAIMTFFSYAPVQAATKAKAPVIPQVQFASAPVTEYTVGDRVRFDISAPNYGGKVEYRVVLWEDSKKAYHDLWNSSNGYPNRYYTKWQPWGNNVFTLGWPILEPGNYRITVYAKRVGISNSKAFLKGQNCDSYKESVAFTVKPKLSVLDKEGQTYGSKDANKLEIAKNDVKITAKNVTLNNASVEGDLYISADNAAVKNVKVTGTVFVDPGKEGSANLDNVTAKSIKVISGGVNSIHLSNVTAETLLVSSTSTVRVETTGTTKIGNTVVTSYSILDAKSGNFGTITVSKSETGKYTVELRGTFTEPVVVETEVTLAAAQGAVVPKVVVSPENKDQTVTLQGAFNVVEVAKEGKIVVAEGASVTTVDAKANADVTVSSGATVGTVNNNGNDVSVDNGTGTTPGSGSTGSDTGTGGGTTVYDSNKNLNNAVQTAYNLYSAALGENYIWSTNIDELQAAKVNNITVNFNEKYADKTVEEVFGLLMGKVKSSNLLTNDFVAEQIVQAVKANNSDVKVNGMDFNAYIAGRLNNPTAKAFFADPTVDSYKALVALLNSGNYDEYSEVVGAIYGLLPADSVINNVPGVKMYGLTLSSVTVKNTVNGKSTVVYTAGSTEIKPLDVLSSLKTTLGITSVQNATLADLDAAGAKVVVSFKDAKNVTYTYNVTMKLAAK